MAITVLQPGDVRVDEDATGHATSVEVVSGGVQVDGPGISQKLNAGDQLRIHGADAATGQAAFAEPLAPGAGDALDSFSDGRDGAYANGIAASSDYLNAETTGSADLANYGSWDTGGDDGAVWFPVVAVGWQPYCYGHWAWNLTPGGGLGLAQSRGRLRRSITDAGCRWAAAGDGCRERGRTSRCTRRRWLPS